MVDLPHQDEDLSWIVSQGPSQLLLIPGVQAAHLTAAAAGDAQALAYLRTAAQRHADLGAVVNTPLDDISCAASHVSNDAEQDDFFEAFKDSELRHVFEARRSFTVRLLRFAAQQGRLAALKWLRALCHQTWEDDEDLMIDAARHGHLHVLKFLQTGPRPPLWGWQTAHAAVAHPDCFVWLLTQTDWNPCTDDIVEEVAAAGNVPGLEYLYYNAADFVPINKWDARVIEAAASSGCLPALEYVCSLHPPIPWDATACSAAARSGNLEMLKWMRNWDEPMPWDEATCSAAVSTGNLEMLQWLRSQQPPCPWSTASSREAAAQPTLHMMQWLQAQDPPCPIDSRCTLRAAGNGLPMLQWLLSQNLPVPLDLHCPLPAARRGDLPMLQLLFDLGCCPTGREYYAAAPQNHIHVLRWLHRMDVGVDVSSSLYCRGPVSNPVLLFLGDIGAALNGPQQTQLVAARRTFCTFYGLLRWCRSALSDPSRNMHRAFDPLTTDASGKNLLVRLSMLPPEILSRIAVAAGLQHTLFDNADDDQLYPKPPDPPVKRAWGS